MHSFRAFNCWKNYIFRIRKLNFAPVVTKRKSNNSHLPKLNSDQFAWRSEFKLFRILSLGRSCAAGHRTDSILSNPEPFARLQYWGHELKKFRQTAGETPSEFETCVFVCTTKHAAAFESFSLLNAAVGLRFWTSLCADFQSARIKMLWF